MTNTPIKTRRKRTLEERKQLSIAHLGQVPWNKGLKGYAPNKWFRKGHEVHPNASLAVSLSNSKRLGNLHPSWKGDEVSYSVLHGWIHRNYGFPPTCEQCGLESSNHRKIHWANISKQYKRVKSDWKRLCVKCHFIFDKHPYHVK